MVATLASFPLTTNPGRHPNKNNNGYNNNSVFHLLDSLTLRGYTPAECTLMGVPSVTTNLAGFGCYMQEKIENSADFGIYVVDRRSKSVEESIQQLADYMFRFTQLRFPSLSASALHYLESD